MAELLLTVVDKVNPNDPLMDCKLLKRGYVVVVLDDGWPWSALETNSPEWCLLQVPGVPVTNFSHLLTPEAETDPGNPNPYLQSRAFMLDLDSLLPEGTFTPPVVIITTEDAIASITIPVLPIENPAVIGRSPFIIG